MSSNNILLDMDCLLYLKKPFHGVIDNLFFGLLKGSRFVDHTFQAVYALLINCYKSMNHGYKYVLLMTIMILFFTGIIYMDNVDLLIHTETHQTSNDVFFDQIQATIKDWSEI